MGKEKKQVDQYEVCGQALPDLKKLKELKNKMRVYPSKAEVFIVQPGVDSMNISTGMEWLLYVDHLRI